MQIRVLGIGEVIPPLGEKQSALDLMVRAARAAIADAAIEPSAIDGVVVTARASLPNVLHPTEGSSYFAEYLGIRDCMQRTLAYGGVGGLSSLTEAMMMINAGVANYVLVTSGDTPKSEKGRETAASYASGMREGYEQPFGPTTVSAYALAATRHMGLYGTTPEQMAAVPVAARKHAARNPAALHREPLTVDDVLDSRMISTPLRLLDCSPVTDGAAAVVVSSVDGPAPKGRRSVRLVAGRDLLSSQSITLQPDVLDLACGHIADETFQMAGIGRDDVDAIYLYDNFSIHPIIQLESMGFCKLGEGPAFVSSGAIDPGGSLPLNTHGGCFACVNPGMPSQFFFATEATRQLRGEAGERQVPDAEVAVLSAPAGYQSWYQVMVAQSE